jgi:hypothetical protein
MWFLVLGRGGGVGTVAALTTSAVCSPHECAVKDLWRSSPFRDIVGGGASGGTLRLTPMRGPALHRATLSAPFLATLFGTLLGIATFLASAWLSRHGAGQLAQVTAEGALLAALACIAAFAVLDGPARMRRARVPIDRALPRSWWPREHDATPLLAACAGAPLILGAGAAFLLFR